MKFCEISSKMIAPSSIGLLTIASGICYFIWTKNFRRKSTTLINESENKIAINDSHCACCLNSFMFGRGIKCADCNLRNCRKSCSRWNTDDNIWLCLFCHHRRSRLKNNEKSFENSSTAKSKVDIVGVEHVALNSGLDLAAGGYDEKNTMENIHELVEKIVESLVGNVDNTSINRLYEHPAYERLFNEYSTQLAEALTHLATSLQSCITNKPATDTSSMAQTALRELVERAVDEARKLPGLGESVSTEQNNVTLDEQSYEDLLATAILNKVVEKYQKQYVDGNSNVIHKKLSKTRTHMHNKREESGNENGDSNSSDSSMSHDECDCDCSGNKMRKRCGHQDTLALTIEERIEEITSYSPDEDPESIKTNVLNFQCARRVPFPEFGMDIVDPCQESSDDSYDEMEGAAPVDHITPVESWEENWLFQKKKISIQSDPVTMLVPNPSTDYRPLIGDKDAEDTSDLSEFSVQSDDDEEYIEAVNYVIPKSTSNEDATSSTKVNTKITVHDKKPDEVHCDSNSVAYSNENTENNFNNNTNPIKSDESFIGILMNNSSINSNPSNEKDCNVEDNNNQFINSELHHAELINLDCLKNDELPRTPASSPSRNSLCETDSMSKKLCDFEKLNDKLVSIDRNIEEEPIEPVRECREAVINPTTHLTSQYSEQENLYENNLQLSTPPRPGTIAEREHKKWQNAPPIQNNPYSQENIKKRLLERQYSRRSSDVNGSTVLPMTSSPLQIVIGADRPDIKRFGRDYYINESKSPTGERPHRTGKSISSRPSSSLSHHSNSTSSDFEQQENFEPIEAALKSPELKQNNELLERERKNSKNEINAKLNNQGNFDSIVTIFDAKKTFADNDNKRKIRRIDLRAYGFENEFHVNNKNMKKKQQIIPNKLDLRSYGYDSGLRRTQSNNHVDRKVNNSYDFERRRSELINKKSNLSYQCPKITVDNYPWCRSTENFNKIKSAVSVPNISKHEVINDDLIHETNDVYNYESDSFSVKTTSTDELSQRFVASKQFMYSSESLEGSDEFNFKKLSMPSVKELAQAFNKLPINDKLTSKISQVTGHTNKERSTTPEIHIIGTPRQMHSLTARSISREFREGLRHITSKSNIPSSNATVIEQSKISAGLSKSNLNEIESSNNNNNNNNNTDIINKNNNPAIITPERFKNNIEFWEQLQKKK